jgi:secreted PhoX family phosphatase
MAAFPMPNGNVRLIRNHEMVDEPDEAQPIGEPHYDAKASGGTTSLEVRISERDGELSIELLDEFVSLAGTWVNCAGGPTPWGSWLSCEEITAGPESGFDEAHGYIFEVAASATGPVDPVPLRAMGRFIHEAIAVDPDTGIVYETEDTWYVPGRLPGAGLYRFIPDEPGVLAAGGSLQMMAVTGEPGYLTARGQSPGTVLSAHWVAIDDPDPASAAEDRLAVFKQGVAKGAARFARLEGAFHGDGGIYVVSTNGGDATAGQVFHYRPTSADTGELTLVFESPSKDVLDSPDNIVLSSRGGLVMCEDGTGDQFVRGLDREGRIVNLVRVAHEEGGRQPGEFAGSCFSPDGRVLFFNQQGGRKAGEGVASATYALWGPWEDGPL